MPDPLSVAAGVVGILHAAAGISSLLIKFTRATNDAPHQARVIITEVNDTTSILNQLQAFLLGTDVAHTSRTSLLKLDQVINIVSSCVLTFSELENEVDDLETGEMDVLDRIRWVKKEARIASLIQLLQNHKASLSLILNILNGDSITEAKNSVNRLCALVENHYQEMSVRLQNLENQGRAHNDNNSIPESDMRSILTIRGNDMEPQNPSTDAAGLESCDFTAELRRSWVYTRNHAFRQPGFSISTRSMFTSRWSCLSDLSFADVSNISVLNLPITADEVFNLHRPIQSWDKHTCNQTELSTSKTYDIVATSSAKPADEMATLTVHQQGDDDNDKINLCKWCGEGVAAGKASEIDGQIWHVDCHRCNTCGSLLNGDSRVMLLKDGSLICNDCTWSCNVCENKIENLAILADDQAFCADCFKCRNCKEKIENLKYARTSQGIFCMKCHKLLMQRRRQKPQRKIDAHHQNPASSPRKRASQNSPIPSLAASSLLGNHAHKTPVPSTPNFSMPRTFTPKSTNTVNDQNLGDSSTSRPHNGPKPVSPTSARTKTEAESPSLTAALQFDSVSVSRRIRTHYARRRSEIEQATASHTSFANVAALPDRAFTAGNISFIDWHLQPPESPRRSVVLDSKLQSIS